MIKSPQNLQELIQRCQQMSGQSIGALSNELQLTPPVNLRYAKGWQGQLIEAYLGASAGSHALHDFPQLNLELKTIPIDAQFKPLESTYVCTVQTNETALTWRNSWVYNKLKHVLWVPVLSEKYIPLTEHKVQKPILWSMDATNEEILRTDWEELMELMQFGYAKTISAKYGSALHIRPKAANNQRMVHYTDSDGSATKIVPKGFYLRPSFTQRILSHANLNSSIP